MAEAEVPEAEVRQPGPAGPTADGARPEGDPAGASPASPPADSSVPPHTEVVEEEEKGSVEPEPAPMDESTEPVEEAILEPVAEPQPEPETEGPPGRGGMRAADKARLNRITKERDDYLDQLRRTRADFENYRKRILRQQTEHLERAAEALVEKLLPVLDNFDAAIDHGQGFDQVRVTLMGVLEKEGLERVDPAGKPFDPTEADAVAHEDGDDGPVVAEVLRPGYRWKGRVVRPAMVRVRG